MSESISPTRSRVDIIGVPLDLGAGRRGVDMGPYAVRYARLHDRLIALGVTDVEDHGNLHVPIREKAVQDDTHAKFFGTIQAVCDELAGRVERAVRDGGFPIVLGGDHSIAMGTLAGLTRARGYAPGLVWIDAHSDINSPDTSPSGNVHGMPLWFALEHGFAGAARTVQIGLRDVDAHEKAILRKSGVKAFSMTDVDRLGMPRVMEEAVKIAGAGDRQMHARSIWTASIGRRPVPAPVRAGSYRRPISRWRCWRSRATRLDRDGRDQSDLITASDPAALAVGLICSGLGKSIPSTDHATLAYVRAWVARSRRDVDVGGDRRGTHPDVLAVCEIDAGDAFVPRRGSRGSGPTAAGRRCSDAFVAKTVHDLYLPFAIQRPFDGAGCCASTARSAVRRPRCSRRGAERAFAVPEIHARERNCMRAHGRSRSRRWSSRGRGWRDAAWSCWPTMWRRASTRTRAACTRRRSSDGLTA